MTQETTKETAVIKVLLVEDHTLTRMGLKTALKRTDDISVIGEATNGEEAIETASRLRPDVILMDVGMPVMDGIQAAKQIVADYPDIKVIMLTQHDNDRDILASLTAGASGYCLKDVEPERLYTAIRAVNAGDAWLDASIANRVLRHYSSMQAPAVEADAPTASSSEQSSPAAATPSALKYLSDGMLAVDDRTQAAVHAMRRGLV